MIEAWARAPATISGSAPATSARLAQALTAAVAAHGGHGSFEASCAGLTQSKFALDFGEVFAQTRDLSDGGVYVRHPELVVLHPGDEVTGQVQDLPIPAPELRMVVMRVDAEGVGLRFLRED